MKAWIQLVVCLITTASLAAGAGTQLPTDVRYDPDIPTPESVLGFRVGEWHVRHDQLQRYFEVLARASPRVQVEVIGRTHEQRDLLLATVSAPDNLRQPERLQAAGRAGLSPGEGPVVVWQGFSVHGNESSGANASLLLAYYLAAAQGDVVEEMLRNTVVLIDPCLNPDGFDRFARWANGHRGQVAVADPVHREHHEVWPSGRTNHYWFDLNRDWLLLTQPESRARVERFHLWRPHILTDFHEMGSDATYFFQPGVPSRRHPLTPATNQELTRRIATYHARALDSLGQLYYTEETFDDFYYGKGSTYPDVQGSIGILFEQASSRGHRMETPHGELTFETTVRNQLYTALSTLEAASDLREDLLLYQVAFDEDARTEASEDSVRSYLVADDRDDARLRDFVAILLQHHIEVHELAKQTEVDGATYLPGRAYLVPTEQTQYRLIKALMERRLEFPDRTFYDVSTWTLPLSFNLEVHELERKAMEGLLGPRLDSVPTIGKPMQATPDAVSYAFNWSPYFAPRALERLLAKEVRVYASTRPLSVATPDGEVELGRGAIVVPASNQELDRSAIESLLRPAAEQDGIRVHAVTSGLTRRGVDLGSPSMRRVEPIKPLLVVGRGVNAYEAGEVWHLLDTRVGVALTMVDLDRFAQVRLSDYTHVILVDGRYGAISERGVENLDGWVREGGVLIATKRAARWIGEKKIGRKKRENEKKDGPARPKADEASRSTDETGDPGSGDHEAAAPRRYADFRKDESERRISGAIFSAEVDTSHPLGFGYESDRLPVFRNGTVFLKPSENPYETVVRYAESPLLSGFVGEARLKEVAGSAAVIATRAGRGVVVRMTDDPNFRGIWYGTNRLFLNALYFSSLIDRTEIDRD